jgi:hypothetical protein
VGGGRYFGVCVVLVEKGWSVHRLTRGDNIQESKPSQKADGRQDWRTRELLQHSTAKLPPQVWVKGGATDLHALSDGGRRLGVGRNW